MSGELLSIDWRDGAVVMLDQRLLPERETYNVYKTVPEVAEAITSMVIRGAPAIGCAAAMGVALAAFNGRDSGPEATRRAAAEAATALAATRPTAVNLAWALARMRKTLEELGSDSDGEALAERLVEEALKIRDEDGASNRRMGRLGAKLLPRKCNVLTHCNTGALATGGYGTALGVIRAAVEEGKRIRVYADETRPLFQGARLTAWELARDGIDVTLITDSAAGSLMRAARVDVAVVGADRIAANGDVANKIGTYTVAVLCRAHGVPFYVAAPTSTVDLDVATGEDIPIEERPPEEVTTVGSTVIAPSAARVRNEAFDVTPARYVTAIITEAGVARPPYDESLPVLLSPDGGSAGSPGDGSSTGEPEGA